MSMGKKTLAEFLGTFWLVMGGCGTAVLSGGSVGLLGISLAFGLTVVTMAYAIGHISGCHLNPAVSIGLVVSGRMPAKDLGPYIIAQVLGGLAAAALLVLILQSGQEGALWSAALKGRAPFATNGYGEHSPGGYSMIAALIIEVVLTFFFLMVILGATDKRAPAGFAGLAIGLTLALIHLIGITVTNLSVNPARSTGPAIMITGFSTDAVAQLWLFWVAPIVGAILAGIVYKLLSDEGKDAA
jgi:aquaporin Z